ncbi:hypothetical protein Bbelb_327210 [Branchiostoma belcheri]|nr:hypothetical protein Bbelb_327210 [Branchiostoma belcheri]
METLFCGPPYETQSNNSTFVQQWNSTFVQQWNSTFVQQWNSAVRQHDSGLHDLECLVDGLSLLPHVVVLPLAVLLVAAVGHCRRHDNTPLYNQSWVLFPGHSVRWLTIFALLFVTLCEVGEGVMSDSFTAGHHPHLYVPWITAILATLLGSVFYNMVEKLNRPRLLMILGLYHILSGGFKLLRLSHFYSRGVSPGSLRFQLAWASVLLYVLLVAVEGYVLCKRRYLSHTPVEVPVPEDLQDEAMRFALPYASLPAWFSFSWMNWLLLLGYRQPLQPEQLGRLPKETTVEVALDLLTDVYRNEKERSDKLGKPLSLWRVYIRAFLLSWDYAVSGFLMLVTQAFLLLSPVLLKHIITWVTMETERQTEAPRLLEERYLVSPGEFLQNGFVLLVLLMIVSVLRTGTQATSMCLSFKVGTVLRRGMQTYTRKRLRFYLSGGSQLMPARQSGSTSATGGTGRVEKEEVGRLQAMIYKKCLRLPSWLLENDNISMGQVTNHISMGCNMLAAFFFLFHFSWATIVQLIAGTTLLYYQLGWNAVLAVGFMVILLPVDLVIMKKMHVVNTQKMATTDVRLKWINESIQGIKLLKLYAWEHLFVGKVMEARKDEVKQLHSRAWWKILAIFCNTASPLVVTLIAFGSYEYFNEKPLTAAEAFSALTLFYTLHGPFSEIPTLLGLFAAMSVATKRLGTFLQSLEVEGVGDNLQYSTEDHKNMNGDGVVTADHNEDIHEDMVKTLGDDSPSYSTIKNWVTSYKRGKESTKDEHRIATVEDNYQREKEKKVPSWRDENAPVLTAQGSVAAANEFGFAV